MRDECKNQTQLNRELEGKIPEHKQVEQALRESEKALRREKEFAESLVDTAQAIVLVLDTQGRILRFNPYLEELSGFRLEEVQGKDWFSTFLPEGYHDSMQSLFEQAIDDVQTRGNTNPIVTKDGKERQIEWYDKTLLDADGNTIGLLAIGHDITQQKRAEEITRVNLALQRVRNEVLQMDTEESWDRVILSFHEELKQLVEFNACSINLVDLRANQMRAHAVNPEKGGLVRNFREPVPPALVKAMESGQYQYRRTRKDPLFRDPVSTFPGIHSIIDIPFLGGTLAVNDIRENAFSERDIFVLEQFGHVMSEAHRRLQDITERKQAEDALQKAHDGLERRVEERTVELRATNLQLEKEITQHRETERILRQSEERNLTLVKESHHRVKNNLQVVSSLLELQASHIEDETVLAAFQDSSRRVYSMSLIHERLYQSADLTQIDLADYLHILTTDLSHSYDMEAGAIALEFQLEKTTLGIDAAVSCGLIVNELVTNAFQHAFSGNQKETIGIGLRTDADEEVTLTVWDNGKGIPAEIDFFRTDSLGLKLVASLVRQLNGKIYLDRNVGSRFEIVFDR